MQPVFCTNTLAHHGRVASHAASFRQLAEHRLNRLLNGLTRAGKVNKIYCSHIFCCIHTHYGLRTRQEAKAHGVLDDLVTVLLCARADHSQVVVYKGLREVPRRAYATITTHFRALLGCWNALVLN